MTFASPAPAPVQALHPRTPPPLVGLPPGYAGGPQSLETPVALAHPMSVAVAVRGAGGFARFTCGVKGKAPG